MNTRRIIISIVLLLLAVGAVAYWRLSREPPAEAAGLPQPPASERPPEESEEAKTRRKLLGVWQDEYRGKRTMTLKDDGSGTMLVELIGVQAVLFAASLRFDMQWTLEGQVLKKRTIGGEPADKVNLILNTMGNVAEDTLVELSDDRLLLLDKDGKTKYDWRRSLK